MHPLFRRLLPGLVPLALVTASTALATPNFPGVMQTELKLSNTPDCNLCHVGVQARGTVNTPVGSALLQRGMVAYDEGRLLAALTSLRSQAVDSDGDGTPDVEELIAGKDPNQSDENPDELPPEPSFGCATGPGATAFWMLLVSLGALMRRRPGRGPSRAP